MMARTLITVLCGAFFVLNFVLEAEGAGARKTLKRTKDAAEFADHIEDGIQVSRTANRAKDVVEGEVNLEGKAKDRVDRKVNRIDLTNGIEGEDIVEGFVDNIEKEIAQEILEDQGRKALRKAVR